jgi:eukaryotic-like serine/threonine-protein kinase
VTEPNRLDEVVGGKYRIVRFLASGGMGSVYEAQHTVVRRRFAVKFLHHELAVRRELLARFQREAEAAGALESEHVAAAIDFGIAPDGAPYIVLEYLVGESLEHLLEREERLPVSRATNLVVQACRGVQAAHAAGIVHRDLKPHNLFVCRREDGTDLVKVLDFGVAKLELLEKGAAATRTGTVLGTPSYMSPEQARGEKNIDVHSDVYALGAILYELLSGKKPHPGDSHNAILHHIATQPALPLSAAAPNLPEALVAVVEGALAQDAAARPASADALASALAPWARAEVWPAPKLDTSAPRHSEPSSTLLAPASSASPFPASRAPSGERVERAPQASGRPARVLALGGAVALGVALTLLFARSPPAPAPPTESSPAQPPAPAAATEAPPVERPLARAEQPSPLAPTLSPEPAPKSNGAKDVAVSDGEPKARVTPVRAPVRAGASAGVSERPGGRPEPRQAALASSSESTRPAPKADEPQRSGPVTFDQKNPYQ